MSESKGFFQAASFLGQHGTISQGILRKTACMGAEQREQIALLEAIKAVWPRIESGELDTATIPELIDKAILPFLENLGFAAWQRDVVTDMAIKKGESTDTEVWEPSANAGTEPSK